MISTSRPSAAARAAAALLVVLFGMAALTGYTRPPLQVGPGAGFRTRAPSMIRPLRDDVRVTPILTVGDELVPPDSTVEPFVLYPAPDGIGIRKVSPGVAEIYMNHEVSARPGFGGARVSRFAVNLTTLGVLAGDYLIDGSEGYWYFCAASLVGPRQGFLSPTFLTNEESVEGLRCGVVVAVDVRDGTVTNLPWLGHFAHEATEIVPMGSGKMVAILTEDGPTGLSQLYMYIARNDSDFLAGRGQLYVFRADPSAAGASARVPSIVSKSRPASGRFVPVDPDLSLPVEHRPAQLERLAQSAGCLNFVKLEDAAVDRDEPNAFYFADTGDPGILDPSTGRPVTGGGRVYHARLDPFDPTRVEELSVVLDADEGDDIFRPDNLDTNDRYLMIQEDPGGRGLHPSRVLRYDPRSRALAPLAECAEVDSKGRPFGKGIGGEWESTGIVEASEFFGPDSWLVAVQAHNQTDPKFGGRRGSGQILLLRGPRALQPAAPKKSESAVKGDGK